MSKYAENTKVSSDKSRHEIERTLVRYGADAFSYGWAEGTAVIQFRYSNRHIRFDLPLPSRDDPAFTRTPTGKSRAPSAAATAYEQGVRQRWRALALAVKAKLESVEAGIATFEQEFLAYIVLPDGSTVGDNAMPRIAEAYETGVMPDIIPASRQISA